MQLLAGSRQVVGASARAQVTCLSGRLPCARIVTGSCCTVPVVARHAMMGTCLRQPSLVCVWGCRPVKSSRLPSLGASMVGLPGAVTCLKLN
jgi:hypothetical protein